MHTLRPLLRAVRFAQTFGVRWCEFIAELDMWERVGVACKVGVVVVALVFMLQGRPPAQAQEDRLIPENPTPQVLSTLAAIQEHDIGQIKTDVLKQEAHIEALDIRTQAAEKAIDNLNTKWLCAMGVLAFLQATGLITPLFKKKTGG